MYCLRTPIALAAAAALLAGCGGSGSDNDHAPLQIQTVGNRADLLSDGNALVRITPPGPVPPAGLRVQLNGADVSSRFTLKSDGSWLGVVSGMPLGASQLEAGAQGVRTAALTLTNAGRGGPVLSGPQREPYSCATAVPQAATATPAATTGRGLATVAVDAQCNIASETRLYYKSTAANCSLAVPDPSPPATAPANPCFKPYDPAAAAPPDLARTTTDAGVQVPYIVRVERGTMNSGIYDIAVLFDPARPWADGSAPQPQWNGKLSYLFGASSGQPRRQFRSTMPWTDDKALSRGWVVAVNSMTDSLLNSNRVVMAETVMMMKEHISDSYGPIRHTVGTGCSGGSMNAQLTASLQPGLLDGIVIACALNDNETSHQESIDCTLLVEAYDRAPWKSLMAGMGQAQINAKKAAINGHVDQTACQGWFNSFGSGKAVGNYSVVREITSANRASGTITERTLPEPVNMCQLPTGMVYDPVTNPTGLRCNGWDNAMSTWGKNADGVTTNTTRDNTGLQYGLRALRAGSISAEEFVVLNEAVGSVDRNGNIVAERSVADMPALETAYRAGLVLSPKNLAKIAILDLRGYDDSQTPPLGVTGTSGLHQNWRSFATRERLLKGNGHYDNHAMWRFGLKGYNPSPEMATEALVAMDAWLTNAKAAPTGSIEQRVVAGKPAAAADYCLLSSDAAQTTRVRDAAVCDADVLLQRGASPREAAGGTLANDVLKCQRKPFDVADYGAVTFSPSQLARLQAVFSTGVCDFSKPGVGQQESTGPMHFAGGPGGQPLGAAPVSVAK